jgi:hypothetical protein
LFFLSICFSSSRLLGLTLNVAACSVLTPK